MEGLVKGDVVVTPFLYSDLSEVKVRPAFVVAILQGNDIIACEITSQAVSNHYAISIKKADFNEGFLRKDSNVRPEKIHTIERQVIRYKGVVQDWIKWRKSLEIWEKFWNNRNFIQMQN